MTRRDLYLFVLGGTFVGLISFAASGAPFVATPQKVPDELLCLKDITSVQLFFKPVPAALVDAGLHDADVENLARTLVGYEGLEIVEDRHAPSITVSYRVMKDDAVPHALGFATLIEVKQAVRVVRLGEEEFQLPTATLLAYGLKPDHAVPKAALVQLEFALRKLIGFVSLASGKEIGA